MLLISAELPMLEAQEDFDFIKALSLDDVL